MNTYLSCLANYHVLIEIISKLTLLIILEGEFLLLLDHNLIWVIQTFIFTIFPNLLPN